MDNSESNSQPEFREDEIVESMVEVLEHVQQLDNEEMPNARDVEDWLNLESELLTSLQMSDEEILAAVVEMRRKVKVYVAMRKMRARTRN